ncbi:hypothetical protein JCM18899A_11750 [Nocardioides sp. AN3]
MDQAEHGDNPAIVGDLAMGGVVREERDLGRDDRETRSQQDRPPRVAEQHQTDHDQGQSGEVEGSQEDVVPRSRVKESSTPDFPNQFAVVTLEGLMR